MNIIYFETITIKNMQKYLYWEIILHFQIKHYDYLIYSFYSIKYSIIFNIYQLKKSFTSSLDKSWFNENILNPIE